MTKILNILAGKKRIGPLTNKYYCDIIYKTVYDVYNDAKGLIYA